MNPLSINFDTAGSVKEAAGKTLFAGKTATSFEALMATLTQAALAADAQAKPLAEPQEQIYRSASNGSGQATQTVTPSGSPIAQFEQSLRDTGKPLESFELDTKYAEDLEDLLVESGYARETARQAVAQAKNDGGKINLGKLFDKLKDAPATEGPVFLLSPEDRPFLTQILTDLGLSQTEIRAWLDSLPRKDGMIEVSSLSALLEKAGAQGKEVDRSIVKDLLAKLGLNDQEITSIMSQNSDAQGRISAQGMLDMLRTAADKQDARFMEKLKDLAAKVEVKATGEGQDQGDAGRIKAQVLQNLQDQFKQQQQQAKASPLQETAEAVKLTQARLNSEEDKALGAKAAQDGKAGQELLKTQEGLKAAVQSAQAEAAPDPSAAAAGAAKAAQAKETAAAATAAGGAVKAVKEAQRVAPEPTLSRDDAGNLGSERSSTQAASTARPALPAQVVRQVSWQITQMVQKSQETLKLALKPASLGEVELELSFKDGGLRATLSAETVAGKQALEAGLDSLKQQLASQGIRVDRMEVVLNPNSQEGQAQQAEAQTGNGSGGKRGQGGGFGSGGGASGAEENQSSQTAKANGRINLFA